MCCRRHGIGCSLKQIPVSVVFNEFYNGCSMPMDKSRTSISSCEALWRRLQRDLTQRLRSFCPEIQKGFSFLSSFPPHPFFSLLSSPCADAQKILKLWLTPPAVLATIIFTL